jgi:DNA-binding transcriptional LysR family regulator
MALTIRAIQNFVAVAEAGSISAAVPHLNLSQASITESIQSLESHLGVLLFRRHPRGMSLTHAGHEFLKHTQRIMAAIAGAERALSIRPDTLKGELIIGTTNPLTAYFPPGLLERFRRTFPNVQVRVYEDDGHFIEHQIVNGEVHVGFIALSMLRRSSSFDTTPMVRSLWKIWVSARHRLTEFPQAPLTELRGEHLIQLRNDELEAALRDIWRLAGFLPTVTASSRSIEAMRSLIAAGVGVSVLPDFLFRSWSLDGEQLVALSITDPLPPLELGLAWRRGARISRPAQAFLTVAREHQHSITRGLSQWQTERSLPVPG